MRVNVYAEEMTDRVEIVEKNINGQVFTGLRIYLYMPVTVQKEAYLRAGVLHEGEIEQVQGPFMHHASLKEVKDGVGQYEVDDDSSAITFWGKADLRIVLGKAIEVLDEHYKKRNVKGEDLIRVDYKEKKVEE